MPGCSPYVRSGFCNPSSRLPTFQSDHRRLACGARSAVALGVRAWRNLSPQFTQGTAAADIMQRLELMFIGQPVVPVRDGVGGGLIDIDRLQLREWHAQ